MGSAVYAIATMDTKGEELQYVARRLRDCGVEVKTVDVGTGEVPSASPEVSREEVLGDKALPPSDDRAAAVTAMGEALTDYLLSETAAGRVAGVIGIGGSGGTALITAALRALPIGMPKLMVSTVASGNTAPYVDCSDITMMYSVVDVAGLNRVSEPILGNAAHAMAGMVSHSLPMQQSRPAVGMTMFGVTTPLRDVGPRKARGERLRRAGISRHRHWRPGHGEAGRVGLDRWCARYHHDRSGR